jgi:hypothetical protein
MTTLGSTPTRLRALAAGLLAGGLLIPASAIYASPISPTGTITGTVTCGDAATTPAPATIAVEGIKLSTSADTSGNFTLTGLPASQTFTIDAVGDAQTSSRRYVSVQPGETVDIGNLDLAVCPQPRESADSSQSSWSQEQMAQP